MQVKYKQGDVVLMNTGVKNSSDSRDSYNPQGTEFIVQEYAGIASMGNWYKCAKPNYSKSYSLYESELSLKNKNNKINNMNLIEKFKLSIKKEPQKSFIQAGVLNTDETFTDEGKEIFLNWLLELNGHAFKKEVVDPIIESDKKEEK